jgi:ADP-dependent NAD(P)H-hydrate dehydratase / NAD(P)H-hydrate epimerase
VLRPGLAGIRRETRARSKLVQSGRANILRDMSPGSQAASATRRLRPPIHWHSARAAVPTVHLSNPAQSSDLLPVLCVDELRAIEASHAHLPLMECAGTAAGEVADREIRSRGAVVVLAGPGNNGGDGFVLARALRTRFHDVTVVFRADAGKLPADAKAAYEAFIADGGATVIAPPADSPALIIDALFGIGLTRPLAAEYAELVEWANGCTAPILALDIPSGLDAQSGHAHGPSIRAASTATFLALKPGLLTGEGPDLCGQISVHDLGVAIPRETRGHRLDWPQLAASLPPTLRRMQHAVHKGTFGTLAIVGGAAGMVGAAILAGRAALRVGAGKVRIGMLAQGHPAYDFGMPELMIGDADGGFDDADALVVGPGLGLSPTATAVLERALAASVPLLLDADALNALARDPQLQAATRSRSAATLVTPHPAEAARLLGVDVASVQRDRLNAALEIARMLNASVVLKGAGSVLAYPDGRFDINASGNAALATAGTGDVLSGFGGAFLAQRLDATTALRYAVCLHGAAADALVASGIGPVGLGASELPDAARRLVNQAAGPNRP